MLIPAAANRPAWGIVKRIVAEVNCLPFYCFVLFILFNAVKITVFNQLIVENGSLPRLYDCTNGFFNKLILVGVCSTILLRIKWRLPMAAFYLVQTVYILLNLMYYFSFQSYLHISQYSGLFSEALDLITHAALPWDARSLFVLTDFPFLIVILITYRRLFELNKRIMFKPALYGASVLFLVAFYKWEIPVETPQRLMNNAYESDLNVVKKYGLLTFNLFDLINYRSTRSQITHFSYGPGMSAPDTTPPHPNILIIQVESLDAYIIDYRYKKKLVMPYLHDLSRKCIFYPYVLSYHLAGSTSDCEFSVINSVEPFDDFPSIKIRDYDYPNSILKRFSAEGYSVIAFHGNRGTYFNRNSAFKRMGFQKFYDIAAMSIPEIGWGASDESVFDFIKSRLPGQKQPFLYYCITMSSHEPFIFVKPYYRNSSFDDIADGPMRNYLNSMSYVDNVLIKFITAVLSSCPNTFIFIFGDHTPTLPKCGYSKSMIRINNRRVEFVPIAVITPDNAVYRESAFAASFLDIAPTLLAAGRCNGSLLSNGLNLLSLPAQERDISFRGSIYSRKFLYNEIERKR